MNESLTTESHAIAALPLTRYEGGEPVKSSGLGLGGSKSKMMKKDVLLAVNEIARRVHDVRQPCANGQAKM